MFEYLLITVVFCFEIFIISKTTELRRKSRLCAMLLFLQFWIFYGFRDYTVLPDTETYYRVYTHISSELKLGDINISDRFGIAYQSLEYLFKNNIGLSFIWFLSFVTFFILWGSIGFLYKYSPITWISIFLFVISLDIFNNLIAIRQGIALSIGLMSFPLLVRKRYMLFSIAIAFAYTFHSSALGYLLLIPIWMDSISYKTKLWIVLGGGITVFLAYSFVFEIIETISGGESRYLSTSKSKDGVNLVGIFSSLRTLGLIVLIFYLKRKRSNRTIVLFEEALFLICLLDFAISIFGIRFWIMGRFRLYFDPFLFVYISILYKQTRERLMVRVALNLTFIYIILCALFLAYKRPEWIGLLPYKFYDSF